MLQNRIQAIACGIGAFAPAHAAIITVPGDAASLTEAVQIAEDGDTIYCRGDLITGEVFMDFDRKRLTLYAGEFGGNLDELRTSTLGALWIVPDGVTLWGDGFDLGGIFRIRNEAEAAAISTGSFISRHEFIVGEGAQMNLLLPGGSPAEFHGSLRLESGSSFEISGGDQGNVVSINGTMELGPGTRFGADFIGISYEAWVIASDAELDVYGFNAQGGGQLWMTGGVLSAREIQDWPDVVHLAGTDVFHLGSNNGVFIRGDFQMRDSAFVSGEDIEIYGSTHEQEAGPVFERVTFSAPEIRYRERVIFSGVAEAGASVVSGALDITGDTTFYGYVYNDGQITVLDGDLQFLGGLDNQGSIVFESDGSRLAGASTLRVMSDLGLHLGSSLVLPSGGRLIIAGSFNVSTRSDHADIRLDGAEMTVLPGATGANDHSIEAFSVDLGPTARGFDTSRPDTWPFGTVRVTPTVDAQFVNEFLNHPGSVNAEAVYVETLVVEAGAGIESDGVYVYYHELLNHGKIDTPERFIQVRGCEADLAEPYGTIDLADVTAFTQAFTDAAPLADYRPPYGLHDLADVIAFVDAFGVGCDP